jgi:hypothetical protein
MKRVILCVCVLVGARVCVCVCVCVRARAHVCVFYCAIPQSLHVVVSVVLDVAYFHIPSICYLSLDALEPWLPTASLNKLEIIKNGGVIVMSTVQLTN